MEEVLYEHALSGWRITSDLARFGDVTYAVGQINSVSRHRVEPSKTAAYVSFLIGAALFACMVYVGVPMMTQPQYSLASLICPAFIGFTGLTFVMIGRDTLRKARPRFTLSIHTSAMEKQWVVCQDEAQMLAIEAAVMTAVSRRGK